MVEPRGLPMLPIACTLTAADGTAQLAAWQSFNAENQLDVQRSPGMMSIEYANHEFAAARLAELVRIEQTCCAFARWEIEHEEQHLQLRVTGTADAIASLTILESESR